MDTEKYITDFDLQGSCNYAFNLIMREPDSNYVERLMEKLLEENVEYKYELNGDMPNIDLSQEIICPKCREKMEEDIIVSSYFRFLSPRAS